MQWKVPYMNHWVIFDGIIQLIRSLMERASFSFLAHLIDGASFCSIPRSLLVHGLPHQDRSVGRYWHSLVLTLASESIPILSWSST